MGKKFQIGDTITGTDKYSGTITKIEGDQACIEYAGFVRNPEWFSISEISQSEATCPLCLNNPHDLDCPGQ